MPIRRRSGRSVGNLTVRPYDEMRDVVRDEEVVVAVLAVPSSVAQTVADDLVDGRGQGDLQLL